MVLYQQLDVSLKRPPGLQPKRGPPVEAGEAAAEREARANSHGRNPPGASGRRMGDQLVHGRIVVAQDG